ncbi:MAG: M24 family metallopeptidase [Anaerolineae bacterium]|nr:M24 family metallopeptidase [Anaerolineae bacterium]
MKSDLDRLMAQRDLQALVAVGDETYSAPRDYLTNGAHVTGGLVIKKRGEAAVMVVNPMEVEEAAASGLTVYSYHDFGWADLVKAAGGDRSKANVQMWGRALHAEEVPSGKIGIYGTSDVNVYIDMVAELNQLDGYSFVGERGLTVFDEAYITKDADERARLEAAAAGTSATLRATWDYIASQRAEGDTVVKADGSPLTIGDVKRFVRRTLLDHDLEDTDMIFAQGRDAGFPHSRGQHAQPLRLGQSIIFDLFPREVGGGYYHDVTRTWCIGYAPAEVQKTYETVMHAFEIAMESYEEPGQPTYTMQEAVLDYYESLGHPTQRSQPSTMNGYVHTLGHGVGLNIHERPSLSHVQRTDKFQVGNALTIEPGLYYPDEGFGVRVEDTVFIDDDGHMHTLTDFRKDLVITLRG